MLRWLAVAVLVGAIVALGALNIPRLATFVEEDLAARITTNLAEKGLLWADVETQGRDAVLAGRAPGQEAKDTALTTAENTWGVASVTDAITLAPEVATTAPAERGYGLTITKTDDKIILSGVVPDEDTRRKLLRIAHTNYGAQNVEDKLTLRPGAPMGWSSAVGVVLFNLGQYENATATFDGMNVVVVGTTIDMALAERAQEMMKQALPTAYTLALEIKLLDIQPAAGPILADILKNLSGDAATSPTEAPAADAEKVVQPADKAEKMVAQASRSPSAMVDSIACTQLAELAAQHVRFPFDYALITAEYVPFMNQLSAAASACGQPNILIEGHTDRVGQTLYNQWLSEQRALAALRYMVKKGVEKERLSAAGFGESQPVADGKTLEGRRQNRRVEFELIEE